MSLLQRQLRGALTEPERLLWDKLRNRKLGGFKFRRQHPIGPYIGDFVCLSPKLVVELDGKLHLKRREYDQSRTVFLNSLGFKVIRFRNIDVYRRSSSVLAEIEATLLS
jgi:very-short-patch-repair endonuclease